MMPNLAKQILLPPDSTIFRTVFLYVGQGDSTLHIVPNGEGSFLCSLVDICRDRERGGIDVVALLEDLLADSEAGLPELDLFINTHPHRDHISGLDELNERIKVGAVWHTGFEPSQEHEESFEHLQSLIDRVTASGGQVFELQGTRRPDMIGAVTIEVLSPAPHVKDEIDALEGEDRDRRIHEYCGVFRLGYGRQSRFILQTGDANKRAWKEHILGETEYHSDRLPSDVFASPHHGSRTCFKDSPNDEDPYVRHLELADPYWVIISSPRASESPHGHPHEDALEIYRQHVDTDRIMILGERRECVIYDIYEDGGHSLYTDRGELVEAYNLDGDDGQGDGGDERWAPAVITRVDSDRPMG